MHVAETMSMQCVRMDYSNGHPRGCSMIDLYLQVKCRKFYSGLEKPQDCLIEVGSEMKGLKLDGSKNNPHLAVRL